MSVMVSKMAEMLESENGIISGPLKTSEGDSLGSRVKESERPGLVEAYPWCREV